MPDCTPTRITWSDDDKVDPFPPIIEVLNEVLLFAKGTENNGPNEGIIGGGEVEFVNDLRTFILDNLDNASKAFITAKALDN